jgi:phage terminase small subunit
MMLSNGQRKFCQLVVDGVSQTEAYLQTYNGCKSRNAAGASATRMLRNVKIQKEIQRLRKDMENNKELTRLKKRQILCDIATDASPQS